MRTCTRCGTRVPVTDNCPTCLAAFPSMPEPAEMTTAQRLAEFDSWFLTTDNLPEIPNTLVARRVAALIGQPIHPLDLATRDGRAALRRQIVTGQP